MARRKITLQAVTEQETTSEIDSLVKDMGDSERAFVPTNQNIYEVELGHIRPDDSQSRHILPFDLREQLINQELSPAEAMTELLERAKHDDPVARLILGANIDVIDEDTIIENDRGLFALADSIKNVGLRQPINIYTVVNPDKPGEPYYQIGEGERRYWAHQLLVSQGHKAFETIRCLIETLPDDKEIVRRRQEAENAPPDKIYLLLPELEP